MRDAQVKREEPRILRLLDRATQGLNVIGSALILALVLLVGADVAGRNLFGAPVPGVPELVSLTIVGIVFLQIPQCLRTGRMSRTEAMDMFLAARAPALRPILHSLFDLIGMALIALVVTATWPMFVKSVTRHEYIGAVGNFTAPTWPVRLAILIGSGFLILQFAARIWRRFRGGVQ